FTLRAKKSLPFVINLYTISCDPCPRMKSITTVAWCLHSSVISLGGRAPPIYLSNSSLDISEVISEKPDRDVGEPGLGAGPRPAIAPHPLNPPSLVEPA